MAPPESRARLTLAVRCTLSVLVLGLVGAACLAGCSPESRRRAFVLLFEDTPPGGDVAPAPVVRRPRHPLPPTPTPTPADVAQAPSDSAGAALFSTWDDVLRRLPKDALGNPDWSVALAQRVIAPRPGIAPNAVETDVLALDIELAATSDPAFAVIFSHQQHGAWLACPNCHTDLFEMSARTPPMTAQEAHGETRCGACHGKVAFDVPSGCPLCHLQTLPRDANGDVDWTRAVAAQRITPRGGLGAKTQEPPVFDRDVELTPAMQPALRAVFSHLAHGQWLTCANCHPSLFPTDAAAPELRGADLHSRRYCGAPGTSRSAGRPRRWCRRGSSCTRASRSTPCWCATSSA